MPIPTACFRRSKAAFLGLLTLAVLLPRFAEAQRRDYGFVGPLPFHSPLVRQTSGVRGDFDGDHLADLAVAKLQGLVNGSYRYRIDVFFAGQQGSGFDLESGPPGGVHIFARDVDGDEDLDLVLTSEFGRQPVGIWINDGHGQFTKAIAESYAKSIWQETDRDFEGPGAPDRSSSAWAVSGGGWTLETVRVSGHLHCDKKLSIPVAAHYPAAVVLNSGNPFRAPPRS